MNRLPDGLPLPARLTLAQMAALQVPYASIAQMELKHGVVINFELSPYVRRVGRYNRRTLLKDMCECKMDGDCLCYFGIIREEMIDCWWNDENDYILLGDWCR